MDRHSTAPILRALISADYQDSHKNQQVERFESLICKML